MVKLTKVERADREEIEAWMNGTVHQRRVRDKPAVPVLDRAHVFKKWVPADPQRFQQYWTPPEMAASLFELVEERAPGIKGAGALIESWARWRRVQDAVVASEIAMTEHGIGKRLLPWVTWERQDATTTNYRGEFDVVLMNPPFAGDSWRDANSNVPESVGARRMHWFLWLALWGVKIGGHVIVIAPYNLLSSVPKAGRREFPRFSLQGHAKGLPGEFANTSVQVDGWVLKRHP